MSERSVLGVQGDGQPHDPEAGTQLLDKAAGALESHSGVKWHPDALSAAFAGPRTTPNRWC